jgi:hypothetical protein
VRASLSSEVRGLFGSLSFLLLHTACIPPCPETHHLSSLGTCVPLHWHCSPMFYAAEDGCDCDCGAPDPDCRGLPGQNYCYNAGRPLLTAACHSCIPAPSDRVFDLGGASGHTHRQ